MTHFPVLKTRLKAAHTFLHSYLNGKHPGDVLSTFVYPQRFSSLLTSYYLGMCTVKAKQVQLKFSGFE